MSDRSNRVPPVPQGDTGRTHDSATGRGPQRADNEPQVAPDHAPQANIHEVDAPPPTTPE